MNGDQPQFRVLGVGRFSKQLDELIDRARSRGLSALMIEIIRHVMYCLGHDPRDWGDPYTNYRGLHAVGYGKTIIEAGIRVEYAVHDTEDIVWLSAIRALPNGPFA